MRLRRRLASTGALAIAAGALAQPGLAPGQSPPPATDPAAPAPDAAGTATTTVPAPPPSPPPKTAAQRAAEARQARMVAQRAAVFAGPGRFAQAHVPKARAAKHKKHKKHAGDTTATGPHVTVRPSPLVGARFALPPALMPIYQAAATSYGIPWQILAAINSVETDFGRNVAVSTAGAVGWMQFMPATWSLYSVDANADGRADPGNPADAIFAAARYLRAAGGRDDLRKALFAYNHAQWYVDLVLRKAHALWNMPARAVAAVSALADGVFPVPGPDVRYTRALNTDVAGPAHRSVVASVGGRVIFVGHSRDGAWIVLEDAYGNRFTYGHLGRLARQYPKLRPGGRGAGAISPAILRHTWPDSKERLAAHPRRAAPGSAAPPLHYAQLARAMGVRPSHLVAARLRAGAEVPAGTTLGWLGGPHTAGGRANVALRIVPPGRHAHSVPPGPLLDAWRRAARGTLGPTTTRTRGGRPLSLGSTLLLDDRRLAAAILADPRIHLPACGREELSAGITDRRLLVALARLADAGLRPAVAALRCGHAGPWKARLEGRGLELSALAGERIAAGRPAVERARELLAVLPEGLRPVRSHVSGDRLLVRYTVRPPTGAAVGRAINTTLAPTGLPIGAQAGMAPRLDGAPLAVRAISDAADSLAGLPYAWGGGHGDWMVNAYDCSGAVSYALHAGGLLAAPLTSGELAQWGEPGEGHWVTIYANPGHVLMKIGGQFYGTSGFGHPDVGGGPAWFSVPPSAEYLAGFTARHPAGL